MPRFWFGAIFSSTPAATIRDLPQSSSLLTIFVIADSLSWFCGRIPASFTNEACSPVLSSAAPYGTLPRQAQDQE
jgi:hypothetical protein